MDTKCKNYKHETSKTMFWCQLFINDLLIQKFRVLRWIIWTCWDHVRWRWCFVSAYRSSLQQPWTGYQWDLRPTDSTATSRGKVMHENDRVDTRTKTLNNQASRETSKLVARTRVTDRPHFAGSNYSRKWASFLSFFPPSFSFFLSFFFSFCLFLLLLCCCCSSSFKKNCPSFKTVNSLTRKRRGLLYT